MRILILCVFLSACGVPKLQVTQVSDSSVKPVLQYVAPPKQMLSPIEWDFPRSSTQVSIKNSRACIDRAKEQGLDRNAIYDVADLKPRCSVPAIDAGSNLYIGLTEANFRNVVNNYNILLMREKRWKQLLEMVNTSLRGPISNSTEKPVTTATTPVESHE